MSGPSRILSPTVFRRLATVALAAVAVLLVSSFVAPDRTWANALLACFFLVTLGVGGALFIALTSVCGAGWHVAFRRVPEAMTGLLPLCGVVLLPVLMIQMGRYAWHGHGAADPGTMWFKQLWLNPVFFVARAVAIILLWIVLAKLLIRRSRVRDRLSVPSPGIDHRGPSILFLAVFAVTITAAGVDWILALEPMWLSTMWGVYQFSGLILSTLAAMIIACILLRRLGPLSKAFRDDHLHDLGKLLLGFSCFWMYIWFCQYMLIWYSNLPEETAYFITRSHGAWGPVMVASMLLNWVVPFFVLLPRPCKRSESVMLRVAAVVLIGRWIDLYVMIFPPVTGTAPVLGIPEAAGIVLVASSACLLFVREFSKNPAVPRNAPFLQESLDYHA